MLVETHIIQNFAPSNLNRDDTGSPKDCEFGGFRRARISSQCLKRAIRTAFGRGDLLPRELQAERTKRVAKELVARLAQQVGGEGEAWLLARTALGGLGLVVDDAEDLSDRKTQYLLFLGRREIERFAAICLEDRQPPLSKLAQDARTGAEGKAQKAKRLAPTAQEWRDSAQEVMSKSAKSLLAALRDALDGGRAADLALFGRMLANLPEKNIDAASQVAHALSTNQVSVEFDYYTAVDDLKPEDTAGADMIGTIEFNSACFYRYANVDVDQLTRNLGGDTELARQTLAAFLRANVDAVPTGKQNSMAAHNPPSLVMTVVRRSGLWSLANAFVQPVRPGRDGDLIEGSVRALDRYWEKLGQMYGVAASGIDVVKVATMEGGRLEVLKDAVVPGVAAAIDGAVGSAFSVGGDA